MNNPVSKLRKWNCVTQWYFFLEVAVSQMMDILTLRPREYNAMVFCQCVALSYTFVAINLN
ncbi:MAG: hypothetical protein RM049_26730 [Nostoc sp. DedQUE04]|uniref:hypothetical protein n=1 Tax=Nostoc sp. DedQUE04 TaxID=3075390 RepID=UPI002AD45AFE|nr:hypothetical protein [Nostoc sp. DedQUE04]MDZ8138856.1 hypothetical protein [Nostoc sp. DedQUE04]